MVHIAMDITLGIKEKKWHGCRYYVVIPYIHTMDWSQSKAKWDEMFYWCYDTYGVEGDPFTDNAERWYKNNSTFWFRNESDRTMFILRWS